jgi:DNA-binding winged helix-turn-helix (wHTH) protein
MTYRFGEFELDEAGRALSLGRRALTLQPKVFDLLLYLVRHAGRVISKDELLAQVWPDVLVTEASLQRAISLVRKALREGDCDEALKSFSGHGYRFSLDQPDLDAFLPAGRVEAARLAASTRNWPKVVEDLTAAPTHELAAQDHELWAFALECLGRPSDASPRLRDAVDAYESDGLHTKAGRCATTLAKIHLERGEIAVARGWLARAAALLKAEHADGAMAYLLWMQSRFEAFEGRPKAALEVAEQAFGFAEKDGAVSLRALTLGYLGFFNISLGRTRAGLEKQDHAAALAMSSAVDPITGGLIYCNILWSCRCFADWSRAHQWADGFETWCKANFAGTTGACELHRAEVLGANATLAEALAAVEGAFEKLPNGEPWALGDAYRVRGDLKAAIGDIAGAREDYARAYASGWDAEPGNALLLDEAGDTAGAIAALDRVLANEGWFGLQRRGLILAHKARICARAGMFEQARVTLAVLTADFDNWPSPAIQALALEAEARLAAHEAQARSPIQLLSLARQLWTSIGVDHQAARVRIELAKLMLDKGDSAGAQVEIDCARVSAERIGARGIESALAKLGADIAVR